MEIYPSFEHTYPVWVPILVIDDDRSSRKKDTLFFSNYSNFMSQTTYGSAEIVSSWMSISAPMGSADLPRSDSWLILNCLPTFRGIRLIAVADPLGYHRCETA